MDIPYFHVDAFTDQVFKGNPAGVCLLEGWPADSTLQAIAAENRHSETAFLSRDGADWRLRWFTPSMEVDLCGHATLAAAAVLFAQELIPTDRVQFQTMSGPLAVERSENDLYVLDFPARPAQSVEIPAGLVEGLGQAPLAVYKSRDLLTIFNSEEEVRSLKPDFVRLATLDCLAVIATAPGEEVDFVSRCFAPAAGIDEDPVTGSAHCTLIPYWAHRLERKKLHARQISARGGELLCEMAGERVLIGGRATLYLSGTIHL
ncbi:putative isomerase [Desulfolithobacter dissulfuricans]|uniref:Isomerase n=1 Tax=Desulfolithobacter dissulfuricans TaxID=2795293 RepID=A0A915U376_9BACT|nr:PhzF family phenazine biosynthesis protein [Desulfolithobacter dissulfuricans]BCO10546.1 putative isomerase [Desulfolithobacter dissulfuricans]